LSRTTHPLYTQPPQSCTGNICRSPTAEATFRALAERAGRAADFDIDSCGTGGGNPSWYQTNGFSYHEGDPADRRMTAAAHKRGVTLTSVSRPLKPCDFERFQYVIAMDEKNRADIATVRTMN
jgi:protein-tyrosine phosphatase